MRIRVKIIILYGKTGNVFQVDAVGEIAILSTTDTKLVIVYDRIADVCGFNSCVVVGEYSLVNGEDTRCAAITINTDS